MGRIDVDDETSPGSRRGHGRFDTRAAMSSSGAARTPGRVVPVSEQLMNVALFPGFSMPPDGRGQRCGRQLDAATEIVDAVPELRAPLGALVALPHGSRRVDRAIHLSGPPVRSDPLYPAKRERPGRGVTDAGQFSEYWFNGTKYRGLSPLVRKGVDR